jgi:lipid-binding SYLF domain-containing protein
MKTPLLLACTLGLLLAAPAPLLAQRPLERKDLVTRLESCEAILREFQSRPETAIPRDILNRARAIVITNQFKAGFVLGVKDGYGLLIARKADGTWSLPVHIRAGEASLGLQLGARAIETVLVFTDDRTPRLLFTQRLNVGVDAVAIAGPRVAERERSSDLFAAGRVLVYTKARGLYAGATVKGGYVSRDDKGNRLFYNTEFTLPEILDSDWITPPDEVRPLMDFLASITR